MILATLEYITKSLTAILVLIIILSGCKGTALNDFMIKPWTLSFEPPNGPPEYRKGWLDGCRTGMAENDNNLVARLSYGFDKDPDLQENNLYRVPFRDAYIYCALYFGYTNRNKMKSVKPSYSWKPKAFLGSRKDQLLSDSPEGPPNFQYGWKQGCQTGKAATGANYHKMYYSFTKDYRFEGDKEYLSGWNNAFWYCQRYYDIYSSSDRGVL